MTVDLTISISRLGTLMLMFWPHEWHLMCGWNEDWESFDICLGPFHLEWYSY